jgi:lipoyl(octanoyl) transferase
MSEFIPPSLMPEILLKTLGLQPYQQVWQAMQDFTRERQRPSTSEIWIVEHPPVYTQGQAGKAEHLLSPGNIPVLQTDRGGQVTYHGPGQAVIYFLLDLHELKIGVRSLVTALENAVISHLGAHGIIAAARRDAPGVYVDNRKIASLGLRIRRGFSYHGLSLNVDMDLTPFQHINPCGYQGLEVTQMKNLGAIIGVREAALDVVEQLAQQLHFTVTADD